MDSETLNIDTRTLGIKIVEETVYEDVTLQAIDN